MKKKINGKTYNTETSKKVCSYVVNDWTYELYQSKTGEYFTYIYDDYLLGSIHSEEKRSLLYGYVERIRPVSENEVCYMLERSGLGSRDKKVTILNELKDRFCDEDELLKVTGEGGLVIFDFGSWEVTLDIDDKDYVKMTTKGKSVFDKDDLDRIECIRNKRERIRRGYLNERYGKDIPLKTKKVSGDKDKVISTLKDLILKGEINVVFIKDYDDMFSPDDLETKLFGSLYNNEEWEMKDFCINGVKSGFKFNKVGETYVKNVYEC